MNDVIYHLSISERGMIKMGKVDDGNIEQVMTYQKADAEQLAAFDVIRNAAIFMGKEILAVVPDCADRSAALRKLRELRMDCNAAISLNGLI